MSPFTPLLRTATHNTLRVASTSSRAATMMPRALSTTAPTRLPYKDDQDRTSVKPRAHEYTGSGTDEQVAQNADAAFNPDKTGPEEAKQTAGQGKKGGDGDSGKGNPLCVSPANKGVSEGGQGAMEDKPPQGSNQGKKSVASTSSATKGGGSGGSK